MQRNPTLAALSAFITALASCDQRDIATLLWTRVVSACGPGDLTASAVEAALASLCVGPNTQALLAVLADAHAHGVALTPKIISGTGHIMLLMMFCTLLSVIAVGGSVVQWRSKHMAPLAASTWCVSFLSF